MLSNKRKVAADAQHDIVWRNAKDMQLLACLTSDQATEN